jgi:hypothetical protein
VPEAAAAGPAPNAPAARPVPSTTTAVQAPGTAVTGLTPSTATALPTPSQPKAASAESSAARTKTSATRGIAEVTTAPTTAAPATTFVRARRKRLALAIAGLTGLAIASFLIALAAKSSQRDHGFARQKSAHVAMRSDAALPLAPPPLDAAVAVTATDARGAAVMDADVSSVTGHGAGASHEGIAYLVVRTIPDGGAVKVGDQSRLAVKQPGDPTGAATAQLVLPAGRHVVIAELAGYRPEKREVVLERGDHQRIEIAFTKKVVSRPERAPAMGRLTVRTTPWSDVYLGGKKLGQAPFADLELPAGTHMLTFKNPSHPTVTKQVTIKPGQPTKLNFTLP